MSVQQRLRSMQMYTIHDLIGIARQKKDDIEDLLIKEERRARLSAGGGNGQGEDHGHGQGDGQGELGGSWRKLRKVVRLLEIVCKIILGGSQQNSYIDVDLQQDICMRDMQSISHENYERELISKNSEIHRLKKLVQVLSVAGGNIKKQSQIEIMLDCPDLSEKKSQLSSVNRSSHWSESPEPNTNQLNIKLNTNTNTNLHQLGNLSGSGKGNLSGSGKGNLSGSGKGSGNPNEDQNMNENSSGFFCTASDFNVKAKQGEFRVQTVESWLGGIKNGNNQDKKECFRFCQQYSLWNILDANSHQQQLPTTTTSRNILLSQPNQPPYFPNLPTPTPLTTTKTSILLPPHQLLRRPLILSKTTPITIVSSKQMFLKRYKSLIKITIKSLNLLNNLLMRGGLKNQTHAVFQALDQVSQQFNHKYHGLQGLYDDQFCKMVKAKLVQIYEVLFQLSRQDQFNAKSIFFPL